MLKIPLVLVKNAFWFEKGYKRIIALGSPKTYCSKHAAGLSSGMYWEETE